MGSHGSTGCLQGCVQPALGVTRLRSHNSSKMSAVDRKEKKKRKKSKEGKTGFPDRESNPGRGGESAES